MFARLLAALMPALCGAYTIESTASPSSVHGSTRVVKGIVRSDVERDVSLPVYFDVNRGTSRLLSRESGKQIPLYFDHSAYLVDTVAEGPEFLSFLDFAEPSRKGVYAAPGVIGTGYPPDIVASRVFAESDCSAPVELCPFTSRSHGTFYVSMTSNVHSTPIAMHGKRHNVVSASNKTVIVDLVEYNSFIAGNAVVLSAQQLKFIVWSDGRTVRLYHPHSIVDELPDIGAMLFGVIGMVIFIDISMATTSTFGKYNPRQFPTTVQACIVDVSLSCASVAWYKSLFSSENGMLPTPRQADNDVLWDIILTAGMTVSSLVCVVSVADSRLRLFSSEARVRSVWVWARFSYEHCVLFTVAIGSSHVIGTAFVTCMRFLIGIVMAVVLGRDHLLLYQLRDTPVQAMAVLHTLLIAAAVSNCMVQPVFWSSQSFPNSDNFVDALAGTMTLTTVLVGTIALPHVGRPSRTTQPRLKQQQSNDFAL